MTDHKEWEREMSSGFGGMMDGIRSEPMPEESLQRSLASAEVLMTKAATKRGRKNAAMGTLIILPIMVVVSFWISHQFDVSLSLAWGGLAGGLCAILLPFMVGTMVIGRVRAGRALLDCGPHPARKMFLMMTVLKFVGAVAVVVVSTNTIAILTSAFLVLNAIYWLLMSTGRLLICETGVFAYSGLLRWERIQSYRWEGDTDATLMVQIKSRFAFLGRGALPVAIEQKEAVDALLQEHATGAGQSKD